MDLLRSAYTADVRFWKDSARTVKIRWYKVPKDRPFLPFGTIFASYNWDNPNPPGSLAIHGTPLQGEQLGEDRRWNRGLEPAHLWDRTNQPCGTPEQWAGAMSTPDTDPPLVRDQGGNPTCCTHQPPFVDPFPVMGCGFVGGMAKVYYFYMPGVRGDFDLSLLSGKIKLFNPSPLGPTPPCTWQSAQIPLPGYAGPTAFSLAFSTLYGGWLLQSGNVAGPNVVYLALPGEFDPHGHSCFKRIGSGGFHGEVFPTLAIVTPSPLECCPVFPGAIVASAGPVPAGYLACAGGRVSQTDYPDLFVAIGFLYGPNLGDGTFPLPDFRDLTVVGSGRLYGLGQTGGEATHLLTVPEMPSHDHNFVDGHHSHGLDGNGALSGVWGSSASGSGDTDWTTAAGTDNVRLTETNINAANINFTPQGGGLAHNNMQPFVAAVWLIRALPC